jgi:hypothetical protein
MRTYSTLRRLAAGLVLAMLVLLGAACGGSRVTPRPTPDDVPGLAGTLAALSTRTAYLATRVAELAGRVPIEPALGTPTRTPLASPPGELAVHLNPYLKVRLEYPAHWQLVPSPLARHGTACSPMAPGPPSRRWR